METTTLQVRSLYVAAHPDDIEVMTGHDVMSPGNEPHAFVATLGRAGVAHTGDIGQSRLCRRW